MGTKRLWIGGVLASVIGSLSALGLTWESTTISHEATPQDTAYTAVFSFTNDSDEIVTIQSVRSSCGCTVPELEKKKYAPGESGTIEAVFTFGTRTGLQRKTISVVTDGNEDRQDLILEVTIPILIEVRPFFVFWRKGEEISTKAIEVTVTDPDLIEPIGVETASDTFQATLRQDDGNHATWYLDITPESTGTSGNTHFLIKTNFPEENPRIIRVYAGIR